MGDTHCDCSCGRISIRQNTKKAAKVYCQDDLPVTLESSENALVLSYESARGSTIMTDSATLFNYYVTPLKHRSARDIENKNVSSDANTKEQNSPSEIAKTESDSELSRLPVIIPATLTVVIFVACVTCIAYQNYNIEEFPFTG